MIPRAARSFSEALPKVRLFAKDSTYELLIKLTIYHLCRYPAFLKRSTKLVNFSYQVLGDRISNFIMEKTLGKVFLCGKDFDELNSEILRFHDRKVNSVADYGLEGVEKESPELILKNKEEIIKTMDTKLDSSKDLLAVKVTSITSLDTLKKINKLQIVIDKMVVSHYTDINSTITSEQVKEYFTKNGFPITLEEAQEIISYSSCGKSQDVVPVVDIHYRLHTFLLYGNQCPIIEKLNNFSEDIKKNLSNLREHIITLNEESIKKGHKYFVDAEQQSIQHSIDSICRQLQHKFNHKIPYILNTFQAYLVDTPAYVSLSLDICKKYELKFGAKTVRGAYVTEENTLAQKGGYPTPICPNKEETTKNYNKCLTLILENCPTNSHYIIATHNESTIKLAKALLETNKGKLANTRISFGQLKGLADHFTFGLANEGREAFKYMPFGPTKELLAYLLRRIEEAGGYIGEQSKIQIGHVNEELIYYRKLHYKLLAIFALMAIYPLLLCLESNTKKIKRN